MATSRSPQDTIRELRGYRIREPESNRAWILVRLTTADGLAGWGECPPVPRSELRAAESVVLGRSATAVEPVRQALASSPRVRAAVEIAQLDISAKIAGVPLYQLLGGPTRNEARAMAPLVGDTDDALIASMRRAQRAEHRAFSVPLPRVPRETWRRDRFVRSVRSRLERLRAEGGEEVDFVLDGNQSLSPDEAAGVAGAIEPLHPLWLDEPCALSSTGALEKLRENTVIPIGWGRGAVTSSPFRELLAKGVVDVFRPDVSLLGITGSRRIACLAEASYFAVAPYHDGGPVATAAALHLAASIPNFFIQQIPVPAGEAGRRLRDGIAGPVETVRDGFAELPRGPGLGIAIDEDVIRAHSEELS